MASGSKSGMPVSSGNPERPVITTPINTGSRTLYCFGDRSWPSANHYLKLAAEMSPYFVGPMPVASFFSEFLPHSKLSSLDGAPSFEENMFTSVVTQDEEVDMYKPFVRP